MIARPALTPPPTQFTAERVQSKAKFVEALGRFAPDLILAD